ncbi:MAG: GDL motif peptide-associated radical SAM/SPASM maturase [Symploca sp. SIO2E9]|nr:GDL motif peptide-associated radical SAM/SPASM maturase [Symploca sp. SIO2E9]
MPRPPRLRTEDDYRNHTPVHVVWEITLACNLKCQHCGSRAGKPRNDELTTQECLETVDHLAKLGTREITLIGGEAYLRQDWTEIIRAIRSHNIYCAIQTGARNFTQSKLEEAVAAGLQGIGVSIDGLPELHDRLRGVPGSYQMAIDALGRAKAAGLNRSVNTQIGPETIPMLRQLMHKIIDAGAQQWQLQLTVAMGNAVDNEHLILQPYQLLELMPLLAQLFDEAYDNGLTIIAGNNIGYFGPYEHKFRSPSDHHWSGCSAGQTAIGLEADGTVKGCPSLPTIGYAGGNVRDLSLEDIWNTSKEIHFGRLRSIDDLWGFCRNCYYAEVCRGGCTWTSHSLLGLPGNNPYCHYRVLELEKQGLRERVRKVKEAGPTAFAIGQFELTLEPIPGCEQSSQSGGDKIPKLRITQPVINSSEIKTIKDDANQGGRVPPKLEKCKACNQFIWNHEEVCPHCHTDVKEANARYEEDRERWEDLMEKIQSIIGNKPLINTDR